MLVGVDQIGTSPRLRSPQHEHQAFHLARQMQQQLVHQGVPQAGMAFGARLPHGQRKIQEEDTLASPINQLTRMGLAILALNLP